MLNCVCEVGGKLRFWTQFLEVRSAENEDFIILPETKIGGPGEMYAKRTRNVRLPDGVPAVCIIAEGVLYRASQN